MSHFYMGTISPSIPQPPNPQRRLLLNRLSCLAICHAAQNRQRGASDLHRAQGLAVQPKGLVSRRQARWFHWGWADFNVTRVTRRQKSGALEIVWRPEMSDVTKWRNQNIWVVFLDQPTLETSRKPPISSIKTKVFRYKLSWWCWSTKIWSEISEITNKIGGCANKERDGTKKNV